MQKRATLDECCKTWSLKNPALLFESVLADLYRVELPSGKAGALKLFTPQGLADEWNGAQLLAWYGGKGAVDVLGLKDGALLMVWLKGESLMVLCDDGRSDAAAMIVAELSILVRGQSTPPPGLTSIDTRFEKLFDYPETDIPVENRDAFRQAKTVATGMLSGIVERVPLHGDLHFRNVLFDGVEWRLIDPKGVMGPPAYDLANLFINPWDRPKIVLAEGRAKSLARLLSETTGYAAQELIGWAIAHAVIAAVWHISAGGSGRHPLRAFDVLFEAQA
ncbi:MAG: aminoglycoside phosphotransferase family protein [Paracoccaceae bacterium]